MKKCDLWNLISQLEQRVLKLEAVVAGMPKQESFPWPPWPPIGPVTCGTDKPTPDWVLGRVPAWPTPLS